jgi:hypothetical protein
MGCQPREIQIIISKEKLSTPSVAINDGALLTQLGIICRNEWLLTSSFVLRDGLPIFLPLKSEISDRSMAERVRGEKAGNTIRKDGIYNCCGMKVA